MVDVWIAEKDYGYGETNLLAICTTVELAKEACRRYDVGLDDMREDAEWHQPAGNTDVWEYGDYVVYRLELDVLPEIKRPKENKHP